MDAGVVGKLGMKSGSHDSSLSDGDRIVAFRGEHFDSRADAFYFGGANEHHFDGFVTQSALADRAVDLSAVGVAANADVERA